VFLCAERIKFLMPIHEAETYEDEDYGKKKSWRRSLAEKVAVPIAAGTAAGMVGGAIAGAPGLVVGAAAGTVLASCVNCGRALRHKHGRHGCCGRLGCHYKIYTEHWTYGEKEVGRHTKENWPSIRGL
jgi:hypothetical protein